MNLVFWIVAAGLVALVASVLLRALVIAPASAGLAGQDADLRVYRDQLAEVERDLARGMIDPEEGARLRAEVARRLLDADRGKGTGAAEPPSLRHMGRLPAVIVLALLVAAGAGYAFFLGRPALSDLPLAERLAQSEEVYRARPSQAEMESRIGPQGTLPTDPAEADLIEQLRTAVAARPDDLKGHELLARTEADIGNMAGARAAFERVVELRGSGATAADHAQLAELMIMAAGGLVTPEAEAQLGRSLALDPGNGAARYYTGLMMAQVGRPDRTFALWRPLLEQGPPEAPWIQPIRAEIEALADAAGIRYSLPEIALPGPDDAALAAAAGMSDQERQAMIEGMVGGLETRLMGEGGSGAEWAQLVRALTLLGEKDRAEAALAAGRAALAQDQEGLNLLNAAAGAAP